MTQEQQPMRDALRQYVLGTLDDAGLRHVELQLKASPEWREALEAERKALAALDALPEETPPANLSAQTIKRIHEADARKLEREPVSLRWLYELAAAVCCVLVLAVLLLPSLARSRESARRSSCQNNLKQMGLVFKMYANESPDHRFPPLPADPAVWVADFPTIYPEFLTDVNVLWDPNSPVTPPAGPRLIALLSASPIDWTQVNRAAMQDYVYLGWTVTSEQDIVALADLRAEGMLLPGEDSVTVNGRTLHRLSDGVERFFITDFNNPAAASKAQSEIPIMFDTNPHIPHGRNVLYLDGHVAFVRDGTFPSTRAVEKALGIPSER